MQRVNEITSAWWQIRLNEFGEIVEGVDDIDQAIRVIILTPKGSDPHRPEFGSDIWQWVDSPVDVSIPNIIREVIDAVTAWEPRARVVAVIPKLNDDGAGMIISVKWELREMEIVTPETQTSKETIIELT